MSTELSFDTISGLRLAVMRLARRIRQQAATEATPTQLSALATLARWGPMPLNELARRERIGTSTVTRLVSRLEDKQYVARRADPNDRRVTVALLDDRGRDLLARSSQEADSYLGRQAAHLTPEECRILARAVPVLERLLEVRA